MDKMFYKNVTKKVTIGQALKCMENGIYLVVNDGRDITAIKDKEWKKYSK